MTDFSIRPIKESDKESWLKLWEGYLVFYESTLDDKVTETTFARFFDETEPVYAVVAEATDGNLIGFVTWVTHRSTWAITDYIYLHDLFVAPDSRLHGVGRKLIEYVYGVGNETEADRVYWHTQVHNHRAQLLYTKVGKRDGFVVYRWPES
ncbi:acyl-CoA N-acyltransferase [Lipomyces tetrasporus]|uniref:Acyl-CoA N-acyltransferase n=1 Tax=Lipomyces tetrasporus TaxID=54092 RepID=A0AAD7VQT3_9ASCO|nr:acyl-CoA N-acyltransferase [Lipomyces tetrasporus]KAJ8098468.1 acyl-CoA N-acyltransferase [Lipomyces tetrasporus]